MELLKWIAVAGGIFLIVAAWGSLIHTLIVPRGLSSRLSTNVERVMNRLFLLAADRLSDYEAKDRLLAHLAPLSLLALLVTWLALFLAGFGLVLWRVTEFSFADALRASGSSLFTLGFLVPKDGSSTSIAFFASATGLVVIALQIAYLPVLYQAFNRRETTVTTLESRAGAPAWGPEILTRHHAVGLIDNLPAFYAEWERWSAEVAESHTTYPILISFRSPHPLRHWVVGLLAVLDSAALYNALCPSTAPSEARLCLRMGFLTLRGIAQTIGVPYNADPMPGDPIELTFEEFAEGVERMRGPGFPMERTAEEAWPHFHGWRVNYEATAYALCDRLLAVPGRWTGTRTHAPGIVIDTFTPIDRRPEDPSGKNSGPATWKKR
ncbi:MAG: hypothetical protein ABR548_08305 [Actinomycetota bacterium]|nr:hypothetical protein [Actinomycetota bacterium]